MRPWLNSYKYKEEALGSNEMRRQHWRVLPRIGLFRVLLPELGDIKNIKGMTLVQFQKRIYLLMVFDDGDRKKNKGAHYYFLDTSTLTY